MELLRVENLTFSYPEEQKKTIQDISFAIERGEFVLLHGRSGCGKTTLLRLLKKELAPKGEMSGRILYAGNPERNRIGFVMQNPDNQIVTDKVWHELAFGMENMGIQKDVMRRRIAETAEYFGIDDWLEKSTADLSGGEKQILNLASVMVMEPELLLLDEPVAQLDPVMASTFFHMLRKLNEDTGLTIIMAEHELEEAMPVASKLILMEDGAIKERGSVAEVLEKMQRIGEELPGFPAAVRLFFETGGKGKCPVTVREGRAYLDNVLTKSQTESRETEFREFGKALPGNLKNRQEVLYELKELFFRYGRSEKDILKDVNLTVYKGEILSLIGGNGTGKSTLLNVIAGTLIPYTGKRIFRGKKLEKASKRELYRNGMALLPQNPEMVFTEMTLREDYEKILFGMEKSERDQKIKAMLSRFDLSEFENRHPYDLSGGEQQKAALGKVLLMEPELLLLDEPTKGIDAWAKKDLVQIMRSLREEGMTILMVTHDLDFAAEIADRVGQVSDHGIIPPETQEKFLSENRFYTTASSRIGRDWFRDAVTLEKLADEVNGIEKL